MGRELSAKFLTPNTRKSNSLASAKYTENTRFWQQYHASINCLGSQIFHFVLAYMLRKRPQYLTRQISTNSYKIFLDNIVQLMLFLMKIVGSLSRQKIAQTRVEEQFGRHGKILSPPWIPSHDLFSRISYLHIILHNHLLYMPWT